MKITLQKLTEEWANWQIDNGEGRDKNDIRFGQHIHNKYDLTKIFPNGAMDGPDGFYAEKASVAYKEIYNKLALQLQS